MKCVLCKSEKTRLQKFQSTKIYHCINCDLQFMDDSNQKKNSNYLDNYNSERNEKSKLSKLRKIQYELDAKFLQKYISKGRLLDVGCSIGTFTKILESNSNFNVIGIDPDAKAIKKAKQNYKKSEFYNYNLIELQANEKFDCIVFRGSFQFLGFELVKTMEKISNITNKKSKLIIFSLPNSDSFLYVLFFSHLDSLFLKKSQIIRFLKNKK